MAIVIPSILTASRKDLEYKLTLLKGLVDTVQIDVVDGLFAAPPTWPYTEGSDELSDAQGGLHALGNFRYELDLMVNAPEESVESWISAGATRIIIHVESTKNLSRLISNLKRRYGHDKDFAPDLLSFGLSLNIDTDIMCLEPYIDRIEYVQFMGIAKIGKQGVPFDTRVLKSIETFRKKHPRMLIQVDGGVSLQTAPLLLAAGVDRLVVGSALWKADDLERELETFEGIAEEYGTYR